MRGSHAIASKPPRPPLPVVLEGVLGASREGGEGVACAPVGEVGGEDDLEGFGEFAAVPLGGVEGWRGENVGDLVGIITDGEYEVVQRAEEARERYIQVDEFELDEYRQKRMFPGKPTERGAFASAIVGEDQDGSTQDLAPDEVGDGAPSTRGDGAPSVSESGADDETDQPEPSETA